MQDTHQPFHYTENGGNIWGYPSVSFVFAKIQKMPRSCLSNPGLKVAGAGGMVRPHLQRLLMETREPLLTGRHPKGEVCQVGAGSKLRGDGWDIRRGSLAVF